ncbi:MAG: radical SAM protein [Peptostreptococcaceae bacterium]|nr:radical SAM protein [Peptostreptococcaceae bacterium]
MNKKEIIELLEIKSGSKDFYELIKESNNKTREEFNNNAYIFSQIGINATPCAGNCKFCALAENNYLLEKEFEFDSGQVIEKANASFKEGIDDLFIMTTASYPIMSLLTIANIVSENMPTGKRLVANSGDMSYDTALSLKDAGFTGAYHIKRLREGIDTEIPVQQRLDTIDAIQKSGLELYYCIEPIGPEHTLDELAEEILFARDLEVKAMAVMRRIAVPGTKLASLGEITKMQLIKIAAVTRLASMPTRSMNAHETVEGSLLAGVNQLYAEFGSNPRDDVIDTSTNRGLSIGQVRKLLKEYEFNITD